MASSFTEELQAYVVEHDLEAKVNTILNRALRDTPNDPFAVLSRLIKLEAPSLRGIISTEARVAFDAGARPAIEVTVGTARGVCSGSVSAGTIIATHNEIIPRHACRYVHMLDGQIDR